MIIYVDKESKTAKPLCSKPDCMHNDDTACDAYFSLSSNINQSFGSSSVPIQYYNGSLYIVTVEWTADGAPYCYLTKTDKDGKNSEHITDKLDFTTINWMIHRGYFYYSTDYAIKRISMDNPKSEPEEIFTLDKDKSYKGNLNAFRNLIAYDNYIYFDTTEADIENNSEGDSYRCIVNTSTLESSRLEYKNKSLVLETFFDNHLILYSYTSDKPVYYMANLDGSDVQAISGDNFNSVHNYSDGTYYYVDSRLDFTASGNKQVIKIYDKNGTKVDGFTLPDGNTTASFFAQDEDYFLFTIKDINNVDQLVMADKSQIGNINGEAMKLDTLCKYMWFEVTNSPYKPPAGDASEPTDVTEPDSTQPKTFIEIKEATKKLGYNVSDNYDTFDNTNITDGFSVKLSWNGDGGTFTGDFQIVNFKDANSAEEFKKENPLVISDKENLAYISIDEIPIEIYQMLSSIISGNPIAPIEVAVFSGETYKINQIKTQELI